MVLDEEEPPALAATPAALTPVGPEALNLWGVGAEPDLLGCVLFGGLRGRSVEAPQPFIDSPTDPVIDDQAGCTWSKVALPGPGGVHPSAWRSAPRVANYPTSLKSLL